MTGRRGAGDGGVRLRPDGRWEATVEIGALGGRRRRKYVYGRTRADVVANLRSAQANVDAGLPLIDERTRLGTFLDLWLEEVVRPTRQQATFHGYEANVRLHIKPVLGHVPLARLSPPDVQAFLNLKRQEGLAPRTVQYVHATLRRALTIALRWGYVSRNVATLVEPVTLQREPVVPLTVEEARRLLEAAARDRLGAFYAVAVAVGLRPSEALGLRWEDLDLDAGVLRVRHALERRDGQFVLKEPKSRTSRRTVALPSVCLDALRVHRRRQLEERLLAGPLWEDRDLVFATPTGGPISRTVVSHRFARLQKEAGVPHHRLYDCRHTAASLLLAQNVHPRVVMEVLGHSSFALTMDTYSHVMPVLVRDAAEAMDKILRGASDAGEQ
ncbi:MAG TPA: site-specific integrase [Acidimicrobiales bacterium]|nr:site-specific integrase [Acidimicrobiales bacterium]